jgi:hypothetical protein
VEPTFALAVEATVGAAGEAVPRRLGAGASGVEVREVLDRWPGAGYAYLKLLGADGATYIVRHDEAVDRWELVQFLRAGPAAGHRSSVDLASAKPDSG